DEPWDSPHNLPLASQMPDQFRCPSDRTAKENSADYVIVVGAETFFPPDGQTRVRDVTDGTPYTVMVAEVVGRTFPWTKPGDRVFAAQLSARSTFGSAHAGGWHALMGDGTCRFIRRNTSEEIARALMTVAGGEPIRDDDF